MSAPQLAPGTVVAQKYQVGACLGYSGSSATYQAASADGREVVLKMFDPAIRQRADIMAAIEQTYAATNALPQDVAVPLLDAGYDAATGAPCSVGERIPFASLLQLASQRPLTPEEVSNILGVLAQLFDRAHARQLFHHAIKPTNIFVGQQGYGVRVTDFGAGLPRAAAPTQEGYAAAAPWMAPEQVQGTVPAGAPADVFATALVVFFALTGRSYWLSCQGEVNLAAWQQEVFGQRTPPSARAMQLGVTLNSAFDGVLGCALSVDPNQRYRSVSEFATALDGVVTGKAPESQATMAFPAGALGMMGGEYPPAPAAQAQYGAAPMQQQQQAPAQQPDAAAGYPGNGPHVSSQAAPPSNGLGETAAGRPIDPAVHQRRPSASKLAPILVGVVAVVLLGGAAAAFVALGRKPATDPAATASASAPSADAPTASASAAPAETASAAPSASAAPPAETASAAPSAEPEVPPTESTLACDPECDEIKLDDKPIELGKPLVIPAGKHTVTATKAGYVSVKETLTVKQDEKIEKTFKLKEKPAAGPAPAPAAPAGGPKPCGKFLKRCK